MSSYRDSKTAGRAKSLGICDFDSCQLTCDGDGNMGPCENLYAIREFLGNQEEGRDTVKKESPDSREPSSSNTKPSHYKVLIIDDEESIRTLIVTLLSGRGHSCFAAADGTEALAEMNSKRFDAVITDIVMREMDGLTLTKVILERYPELPVMIMTGHSDDHPVEEAIKAGAQEFIKKPFSINEIIIRFDKMMRHHQREAALLTFSLTDALTGLYNRRRFFLLAEQYLRVATRTRKRSLLLYIDMDDLKWINDQFGHNEGDQALIDFATILKKTFRESDIIARIGGDEFVVLLESSKENDEILITRLYKNIKDYNATGFHHYILSISMGVAQSEFDLNSLISIDELLSKADALMYAQKRRKSKRQLRT